MTHNPLRHASRVETIDKRQQDDPSLNLQHIVQNKTSASEIDRVHHQRSCAQRAQKAQKNYKRIERIKHKKRIKRMSRVKRMNRIKP